MTISTTYDVGDFGVPLVNVQAMMSQPEKAPGMVDKMQHDAAAEVSTVTKASAQADADLRQANGELEEARKELGAHQDVTASDAFNPLLDLAAVAVAASPAGMLAAAPIFAASAMSNAAYWMNDRSKGSAGEGDNGNGEQAMTADEWVMNSRRAKQMDQMHAPNEGYNRVQAKPIRIDVAKEGKLSLESLKTENGKGVTHFASAADPDTPSADNDGGMDPARLQELQTRVTIAQTHINGISSVGVSRGINSEDAFDYGEKLKRTFGLDTPANDLEINAPRMAMPAFG